MRGLIHTFRCGDWVIDQTDPRHVGRIIEINSGIWATVQWERDDNRRPQWLSTLRLSKLTVTLPPT